jgi:hypothetical protein
MKRNKIEKPKQNTDEKEINNTNILGEEPLDSLISLFDSFFCFLS